MLRAVICKDDKTSHGGVVLEGAGKVKVGGRPIARMGDRTYCPQCKGEFPIAEGLLHCAMGGRGTAVEGMRTACGAKLVASQSSLKADDKRSVVELVINGVNASGQALHRERFRAVHEASGEPKAGLAYRIALADGRVLRGVTDADGHTETVSTADAAALVLHWDEDGAAPHAAPSV